MRGAPDARAPGPLWKRLAWFVALWLGGLAAVSLLAWLLRRLNAHALDQADALQLDPPPVVGLYEELA